MIERRKNVRTHRLLPIGSVFLLLLLSFLIFDFCCNSQRLKCLTIPNEYDNVQNVERIILNEAGEWGEMMIRIQITPAWG